MWALVTELTRAGLERDDAKELLRDECRRASGQESTQQLTPHQAAAVIDALQARLAPAREASAAPEATAPSADSREPWGDRGPGPRGGQLITARQQSVLQALYHQVGMATPAQQRGFSLRQCKTPWPQSQEHFDKLMEPLKAMAVRKTNPVDAWKRAQALRDRSELTKWEQGFVVDLCVQFQDAEALGDISRVLSPHKILKLVECELRCGVRP